MKAERTRRPGETVFGWLMLALSAWLFFEAWRISGFESLSSPGAFPMATSFVMVIASVLTIVRNRKERVPGAAPLGFKARWSRFTGQVAPPIVLVYVAIIVGFAVLLEPLGFVLAAGAFLFVSMLFLAGGGPLRAAAISIFSLVAVYAIFRLLFQVVLPEGILPEREWMAALERWFETFWGAS